ncbi:MULTISPECIES: hypothetical protein [unclassified Streptomyces]|uniref:hypothetical protein n=1 Tax=unclassified Streptomyces TaxID=2593676 RepID=UPI0021C81204|nr:hypothetical protein [Streptomyces sp. FIT100]UUN30126.1 hypothetical protein KK483_30025 [Streptomyces sp. FIT100]
MPHLHLLYDRDFREQGLRTRHWGILLLIVAGLLWAWFAALLFTPYQLDDGWSDEPTECESRFFTDRAEANETAAEGGQCAAERDWPKLLAVLGGSVPFAVGGAVLYAVGTVTCRISFHGAEMARLREDD